MTFYKLTLLKDLPGLNAGFSVTLKEDCYKEPYRYLYRKPASDSSKDDYEYTEHVCLLCKHRDNPEWVKVDYDLTRALEIKCPKCDQEGMFPYEDPEKRNCDDGVESYYKTVGLWCPHCGFRLRTHTVHTRTIVRY